MGDNVILRIVTFILHFVSALFLLGVSFQCSGIMKTKSYTETVTDTAGYPLVMDHTCDDPYSRQCFFGLPQAYDVVQHSLAWNVFALLAAFEWLSASFALYYLGDVLAVSPELTSAACVVWNVLGLLLLMPYSLPLTMLQAGITALSLLAASAAQLTPILQSTDTDKSKCETDDEKRRASRDWVVPDTLRRAQPETETKQRKPSSSAHRVTMHYTEYCTSASLLFVAVLILFVSDPLSWAPLFGFTGILICNVAGIGAQNCKVDDNDSAETPWYDLDWSKCGNHFKLFILHSWLALVSSVLIIIYLARDSLTSSDVPVWVRFILWNLLVTYTLFGVWATLCYWMMGRRQDGADNFDRWMARLDFGLTVLSAAAKLPVAYTVFYGLIQEPGGNVCNK
jgi:hypothetical protein